MSAAHRSQTSSMPKIQAAAPKKKSLEAEPPCAASPAASQPAKKKKFEAGDKVSRKTKEPSRSKPKLKAKQAKAPKKGRGKRRTRNGIGSKTKNAEGW